MKSGNLDILDFIHYYFFGSIVELKPPYNDNKTVRRLVLAAVEGRNIEIVKRLKTVYKMEYKYKTLSNEDWIYIFHRACMNGTIDIANELLAKGFGFDQTDLIFGQIGEGIIGGYLDTFKKTCMQGNLEMAKWLFKKFSDDRAMSTRCRVDLIAKMCTKHLANSEILQWTSRKLGVKMVVSDADVNVVTSVHRRGFERAVVVK